MDQSSNRLYCSRQSCQAPNPLGNEICTSCQTPLLKRYLSVVGTTLDEALTNQVVANRYYVISPTLVLDTQPATPPEFTDEIPTWLKPYLRLTAYRLHIPKVYGYIPSKNSQVWLLEYESFSSQVQEKLARGEFLPPLEQVWPTATATRQLNWLLQIARLWQPLQAQGVVGTLVTPEFLRVNGPVIQLKELPFDEQAVSLQSLGQLWLSWVNEAASPIQEFLKQLAEALVNQELTSSEALVADLEQGLSQMARSQQRSYQIATLTDKGPRRSRNEDAYYQDNPDNQSSVNDQAFAIVCDGVGGHQGGEVASQSAITQLKQSLQTIQQQAPSPEILIDKLEEAVNFANDVICDQNDSQHRKAQQRMGTTVVMALAYDHEMYVTHVGDSRLYWITRYGCYQLTLDDDLASRETRLGHALYRDALQQRAAGALVQALGMTSSQTLHPTTQRVVIDEDSVFLLCSDGLSDYGLVEQYWEAEILPLLDQETDVDTVAQRLVDLANTVNGHDNVTVSLMQCFVSESQSASSVTVTRFGENQTDVELSESPSSVTSVEESSSSQPSHQGGVWLLLLIIFFVIAGVGLVYWLFPEFDESQNQWQESKERPLPERYNC